MARKYYDPSGVVDERGGAMVKYHISSFDGSRQPYAVYVPSAYTPERKWPLIISLHGYSSDHVLNLRRVFGLGNPPDVPDDEYKRSFPKFPEVPCLVASPYAFGSVGYAAHGETDALDVLNEMKRSYNIDEDRVYLTGLSMGGEGTWHLGERFPDLWAAIAPVCGPTGIFIGPEDVRTFAANLLHIPVHLSHGDSDNTVPVQTSREMRDILQSLGYHCEYHEYPGVDHNAWDVTYANAKIFDWFLQFRRVRKPAKVIYTTDRLRYNKAYWIEITRLFEWSTLAKIIAEVVGNNTIRVYTENIGAFKLYLKDAPIDNSMSVVIICNGQQVYSGIPRESEIEIELAPKPEGPIYKRKGLEGPPFDALKTLHAIVYGTRSDDPEYRNMLRCTAEAAVSWSEWADVETPVLADYEVTEEVISKYNLLLLGNSEVNGVIQKVNDRLPIRFEGLDISVDGIRYGSDLGFVEVYPNPLNPEKYIVVLGGNTEEVLARIVPVYRNMPDYGVFSQETDFTKPDTFMAYGYFDENWRI